MSATKKFPEGGLPDLIGDFAQFWMRLIAQDDRYEPLRQGFCVVPFKKGSEPYGPFPDWQSARDAGVKNHGSAFITLNVQQGHLYNQLGDVRTF